MSKPGTTTRSRNDRPRVSTSRRSLALGLLLTTSVFLASSVRGGSTDQADAKAQGKGQFKTLYVPIKNQKYAKVQAELKRERVLELIAENLNKEIALPADLTLAFGECNTVNAFYSPENRRVTICYELLEHFYEIFGPDAKNDDDLDDAVAGAVFCVFYHELGHALTHILDLPITGKEEDAVDQLSLLILADGTDEGEQSVLNGARWFLLEEEQNDTDIDDLPFWDEHSLDKQRFYNLICWLYGHDQKKYAYLIQKGILPKERAERCPDEFAQLAKSWGKLLGPYLK
jgi:Putative metallopeptidase